MIQKNFSFAKGWIRLILQARTVRKSRMLGISRSELAKACITVGSRSLQNKYFEIPIKSPTEVLGYKINFLAYHFFHYLFNEVFLEEGYFFTTKKEKPFIIDCGSNIGASILYFKKLYPKAVIIGFEPFEQAFNVLKLNIEDNQLQDVTVYNLALANSDDQQKLFYEPSKPGGLRASLLEERIRGVSVPIQTTVLSKFITETVDFLKMDIEGSELAVLEELNESKKLALIEKMTIEYHHHIKKDVDCLSRIFSILENNNFGYHIQCHFNQSRTENIQFQDILIHAYKKTSDSRL